MFDATEGSFCSVLVRLPDERTLRVSKWSAATQMCEKQAMQHIVKWLSTNLEQMLEKATTNGLSKFSFAESEARFNLGHRMAPNKNRQLGPGYKLVGLLNECVIADDDCSRHPQPAGFRVSHQSCQVVPKFLLFH